MVFHIGRLDAIANPRWPPSRKTELVRQTIRFVIQACLILLFKGFDKEITIYLHKFLSGGFLLHSTAEIGGHYTENINWP